MPVPCGGAMRGTMRLSDACLSCLTCRARTPNAHKRSESAATASEEDSDEQAYISAILHAGA